MRFVLVLLWCILLLSEVAYSQQSANVRVLDTFRSQWKVLGECLEIKLDCQTNTIGTNMRAYGFSSVPSASGPYAGKWYFSGSNFRRNSKNESVKGGFVLRDVAKLHGDTERLQFDSQGRPEQLDIHSEHDLSVWGETPFFQMYFPGMRDDVVKILQRATFEAGNIGTEPVVIAKSVQGTMAWKYFVASDGMRLLRVSSAQGDHSIQCDFAYKSDAKSWMDLSSWNTATYSYEKMYWSAKFINIEIVKHASLPDETFRVDRPDGVLVIDHAEFKRLKKLGEKQGLAPLVAPVEPEPSWIWRNWNLLIIGLVFVGGGSTLFYFWRKTK